MSPFTAGWLVAQARAPQMDHAWLGPPCAKGKPPAASTQTGFSVRSARSQLLAVRVLASSAAAPPSHGKSEIAAASTGELSDAAQAKMLLSRAPNPPTCAITWTLGWARCTALDASRR